MEKGYTTLLIINRYPAWAVPFAICSMALFRLPLWFHSRIRFWRLMGSGKNGTFDTTPDWRQWALLLVLKAEEPTPSNLEEVKHAAGWFIRSYWTWFGARIQGFVLRPIESHGLWNGKKVFGDLPKKTAYEGRIAVMTRATIRLSKLHQFWSNVPAVASEMAGAEGFEQSYGIGEVPYVKQATFSIWTSKRHMMDFAYKMSHHREVIKKTYDNHWYSEEMFTRYEVLCDF